MRAELLACVVLPDQVQTYRRGAAYRGEYREAAGAIAQSLKAVDDFNWNMGERASLALLQIGDTH